MPEYTVKGTPLEILDMLSSSHPLVTLRLTARSISARSSFRSCATLSVNVWATSKEEGPFSACVLNGFCGAARATGPDAPAINPPETELTSSRDFAQV